MELDTTVNWLDIHWKALFMFKILLLRVFWLIRLHNKFKYNFDIRRVKLSGLGRKVYQVTTEHKLSQEEQNLLFTGYQYLILKSEFYHNAKRTFPIAVNLICNNEKYANWHYSNVQQEFVELVE